MFNKTPLIDLVPVDLKDQFFREPPLALSLRDSSATLVEFYNQLQVFFLFKDCGAAHHFPWVRDQNPDNCPWKFHNTGCSHADTSVSREFRWVEKIVNALNEHFDQLIVDLEDLKLVRDLFFKEYVMHLGAPRLSMYSADSAKYIGPGADPNEPRVFSEELTEEVERVKKWQREKDHFFGILCRFLSDRIQEVLLIPDELQFLQRCSPNSLVSEAIELTDFDLPKSIKIEGVRNPIPASLINTEIVSVIRRMRDPSLQP